MVIGYGVGTHQAHHPPRSGGDAIYNRAEAERILIVTATIIRHEELDAVLDKSLTGAVAQPRDTPILPTIPSSRRQTGSRAELPISQDNGHNSLGSVLDPQLLA